MTREAKGRFKFCFRQFVFHYSTFWLREPSVDGSPRSTSTNVVERAVGVDAWRRRLNGVVRLEALRRRDALEDSGRRARSVAAHGQDARAPVRELDLEDGRSVGPRPLVNVVDETDLALEIGELPADERRDRISAAPAARGRPGAASGSAGRA